MGAIDRAGPCAIFGGRLDRERSDVTEEGMNCSLTDFASAGG